MGSSALVSPRSYLIVLLYPFYLRQFIAHCLDLHIENSLGMVNSWDERSQRTRSKVKYILKQTTRIWSRQFQANTKLTYFYT